MGPAVPCRHRTIGVLHDRMPVILPESEWSEWLGEAPATEAKLMAMLKPCADDPPKGLAGRQAGRQREEQRVTVIITRLSDATSTAMFVRLAMDRVMLGDPPQTAHHEPLGWIL
jgi:SOS response associated peptidase (SRAP)